jgi:hypothetical protein
VDCPLGGDENVPRDRHAQGPWLPTETKNFTVRVFLVPGILCFP